MKDFDMGRSWIARPADNERFWDKNLADFVVDRMGITRADLGWFFWRGTKLYVRQMNRLKNEIDPATYRAWRQTQAERQYRAGMGS